jgi:hypothetical protein
METMRGRRSIWAGSLVVSVPEHPDPGITVHPVVELGAAERERRDDRLAQVQGAGLVQGQHAVGEHLRPHPESAVPGGQRGQDGIGNRADTELQRRARGQHVHLGAEGYRAAGRRRRVHEHHVRGQRRGQQHGDQGQPAREVPELVAAAHARADERGLQRHPVTVGHAGLCVQHEQPVLRDRRVERG